MEQTEREESDTEASRMLQGGRKSRHGDTRCDRAWTRSTGLAGVSRDPGVGGRCVAAASL